MYKHITRSIFAVVVIILWLVAAAVGMEVWARYMYHKGSLVAAKYSGDLDFRRVRGAFDKRLWKHPWIEYKPHTQVSMKRKGVAYKATINGLGFRGPELNLEKPYAHVIACVGGSTTVCGDTDNTTYPALLEKQLNLNAKSPTLVVNAGVCGLNSTHYQRPLKVLLNHVKPDIIIEYNAVNDICWRMFPHWFGQLSKLDRKLLKIQFIKYFFGDYFLPDDKSIRQDIDRFIIANLRSASELVQKQGARFFVCSFIYPNPDKATRAEYFFINHNLRHFWRSDFISFRKYTKIVDLYNDALKEEFGADYIPLAESDVYTVNEFLDLCHLKSAGIEKKAQRIAILLKPKLDERQ